MGVEHALGWTDARIRQLIALCSDGLSASKIASTLGGVTRNAVIGKLKRLGFSAHGRPGRPKTAGGGMPDPRPKLAPPEPPRIPLSERREAAERDLPATDDLTSAKGCRWPIGDPQHIATGGFRFCQRAKAGGSPYCDVHREVSCGRDVKPRARARQ